MSAPRERPPPPSGPRLRSRQSTNPLLETPLAAHFPGRDSTNSTLYSPTTSSPPTPSIKDFTTLGVISEQPEQPPPLSPTLSEPPPSPPVAAPVVTPVPKSATLTPPPTINYDSVPVQWKALPLEAAIWTFTSKELQQLVSRAIRSSARESFVRLLSMDVLDQQLPAELERLNTAKLTAQSRYRFCVHRRTMLLQAINACSTAPADKSGNNSHIGQLAIQLSETTAECDRLLEELLRIGDQQAQVAKLEDVHWASALAVALRKLNGSYGKRTAELKAARERITQLQAELEDAWKEAEKIAKELDDKDSVVGSDDEEADVVVAEHLLILKSPPAVLHDLPMVSTSEPGSPLPTATSSQLPREAEAVPSIPPPLSTSPPPRPSSHLEHPPSSPPESIQPSTTAEVAPQSQAEAPADDNDAATIHSVRSVRSTRSMRSVRSTRSTRDTSRVSQVFAARRRSIRASLGSLRLPKLRGKSQGKGNPELQPPVPDLPAHIRPSMSSSTKSPFSHLPGPLTLRKDQWQRLRSAPVRGSVDDINVVPHSPKHQPDKQTAKDDIQVLPGRAEPDPDLAALVAEHAAPLEDHHEDRDSHDSPGSKSSSILGVRTFQDTLQAIQARSAALKSSPERFLRGSSKDKSNVMLASTRKRYSLSFPLFTGANSKAASRRASSSQVDGS